ncbi:MAG: MFS transporter [Gammaproteobacteria bacterium]|nr:MFS transporter [Gammaproteobacteria bacterium]
MFGIGFSIFSLLLGTALLLLGIGLQGTLLGLRAVEEGFAVSVIGYVMSAYFLGFALGIYLCPPLIRRVGHIRAYAAMAAIASAAAIAFLLFINPYAWSLLRIITGACMVGLYMVVESWINTLAPNHLRGQFFSAYMVVTFVALALAQYLLLYADISGHSLFVLTSIFISFALVPIALTRIEQPQQVITPKLHLPTVYAESPLGVVGTLTAGLVMGAFWGMMSVYCAKAGMDTTTTVLLISSTIIGGALLQWPIGKLSDRVDRRLVISATALIAATLALLNYLYIQDNSSLLYIAYFLYGGFAFSLYSLSVAHVNDRLQPEQALDASQTLLQLYGIGAVLGPIIAGVMMSQLGYRSLLLLFTITLTTFGLFTLYRIYLRKAPAAEEQEPFIQMQISSPVVMEMDPRSDTQDEEVDSTGIA